MLEPRLANQECFECPEHGNRNLRHVRTNVERDPLMGAANPEITHVAVYRCTVNPHHGKREAFDPKNPGPLWSPDDGGPLPR